MANDHAHLAGPLQNFVPHGTNNAAPVMCRHWFGLLTAGVEAGRIETALAVLG